MTRLKFHSKNNSSIITHFPVTDSRGYFSRIYCLEEFKKNLNKKIVQINLVKTKKKGTIRGFHYQTSKFSEDKILILLQGAIYDVFINMNKKSKNYLKVHKKKVASKKNEIILIPRGYANAYQVLENNTKILYLTTNFYNPKKEKQFNPLSNFFRIKWPIKQIILSNKDKNSKHFSC
jgi:dTDP-4-dehydrorhamnose 3,5-epimerase